MEAFPSMLLWSGDPTLAEALPAQIAHVFGHPPDVAQTLAEGEAFLTRSTPALLVVDLVLLESVDALQTLRSRWPLMAMIVLGTMAASPAEAEATANIPICSYIQRPVSIPALVRALQHQAYARSVTAGNQSIALTSDLQFLPAERKIAHRTAANTATLLTDKETSLLLALCHHRGHVVSREWLLENIWGYSSAIHTHTLETHLYRLRSKIRELMGSESVIETDKGGYRLGNNQ